MLYENLNWSTIVIPVNENKQKLRKIQVFFFLNFYIEPKWSREPRKIGKYLWFNLFSASFTLNYLFVKFGIISYFAQWNFQLIFLYKLKNRQNIIQEKIQKNFQVKKILITWGSSINCGVFEISMQIENLIFLQREFK